MYGGAQKEGVSGTTASYGLKILTFLFALVSRAWRLREFIAQGGILLCVITIPKFHCRYWYWWRCIAVEHYEDITCQVSELLTSYAPSLTVLELDGIILDANQVIALTESTMLSQTDANGHEVSLWCKADTKSLSLQAIASCVTSPSVAVIKVVWSRSSMLKVWSILGLSRLRSLVIRPFSRNGLLGSPQKSSSDSCKASVSMLKCSWHQLTLTKSLQQKCCGY